MWVGTFWINKKKVIIKIFYSTKPKQKNATNFFKVCTYIKNQLWKKKQTFKFHLTLCRSLTHY